MKRGWYVREIQAHQLALAGIYLWTIAGVGVYVGQAKRLRSRLRHYPNNVRKLLAGLPYRRAKPGDYRTVHRALAEAYRLGKNVKLSVLETCEPALLNERERYWIKRLRAEAAADGLPILNSN